MKKDKKSIRQLALLASSSLLISSPLALDAAEHNMSFSSLGSGAQIRTELSSSSNLVRSSEVNPGLSAYGEGKCGEGRCGEGRCGEGRCGEGKCGGHKDKKKNKEGAEAKCGEGKCGGHKDKKKNKEGAEAKCGEGKCGH